MPKSNGETIEAFSQACSDAGLTVDPQVRFQAQVSLAEAYYGPIMEDSLEAATKFIEAEDTHLPLEELPRAIGLLARLLSESDKLYRHSSGALPSEREWRTHIGNVRNGDIKLLAPRYWTSEWQGRMQVQRADAELDKHGPAVGELLAALNYQTYFKPQTMADAARTLAKGPEIAATSEELEAMSHLTVTNWVIAQTAQHIYERLAQRSRGQLRIVDMGVGTAGTLSAITQRLGVAQELGHDLGNRLGILGFETTPAFCERIATDFLPTAKKQLGSLGLRQTAVVEAGLFDDKPRPGELTVVQGDVVQGVNRLDFSELIKDDVVMGTANYSFHRLSRRRKDTVIRGFARAQNSIVVIGDLRQNKSRVNRGYFNLSNNGPLNAGNIDLERLFEKHGYLVLTLGHGRGPAFIDQGLRDRLTRDFDDDVFVTMAIKGARAQQLLLARPVR